MGVVDLARDADGNKVALKRLTLHGSASEVMRARQRLVREAKVLRRLRHPNSVRLLDVVEDDDEIVLVMPYLPGGSLAERVAQHGPAPPPEVDRLAQRLLAALAEAHAAGIIHRDIKPANVLYDAEGEPLLADFGLAYTWDQSEPLTVAGMVVGTPGFIAPEQARGEPLTPASDIFSLGATLMFAATGGGPFGNGDPNLLMVRAASGKVERLPKRLPAPLRRRLQRMVDPRPDRRPTAAALLAELTATGPGRHLPRTRSPGLAVAGGVAATVLVATLVVIGSRGGDGGDARETSPDAPSEPGDDAAVPPDLDEGDGGFGTGDERLEGQLEGTVVGGSADTFVLPLPIQAEDGCPGQVEILLEARGNQPLELTVTRNREVVFKEITGRDGTLRYDFRPTDCVSDDVRVSVRVFPGEGGAIPAGPQSYVLRRVDTA
jgi:hypothetical protein